MSKKKPLLKQEFNVPLPSNKTGKFLGRSYRLRAPKYFRESFQEIRKVTWPGRKEAWKLTLAVFIFTALFTSFAVLLDYGFTQLTERVFL